jgi:hypothetical protein
LCHQGIHPRPEPTELGGQFLPLRLHGQCVADIAPRLFAAIPKRRVSKRTVQEALPDHAWISDIREALTVGVLVEYLQLWNILCEVELQLDVSDSHFWRLATSGKFSVKSAYEGLFIGSMKFEPYERIWKTWAPAKFRFFVWLVAHNKCWIADRLA